MTTSTSPINAWTSKYNSIKIEIDDNHSNVQYLAAILKDGQTLTAKQQAQLEYSQRAEVEAGYRLTQFLQTDAALTEQREIYIAKSNNASLSLWADNLGSDSLAFTNLRAEKNWSLPKPTDYDIGGKNYSNLRPNPVWNDTLSGQAGQTFDAFINFVKGAGQGAGNFSEDFYQSIKPYFDATTPQGAKACEMVVNMWVGEAFTSRFEAPTWPNMTFNQRMATNALWGELNGKSIEISADPAKNFCKAVMPKSAYISLFESSGIEAWTGLDWSEAPDSITIELPYQYVQDTLSLRATSTWLADGLSKNPDQASTLIAELDSKYQNFQTMTDISTSFNDLSYGVIPSDSPTTSTIAISTNTTSAATSNGTTNEGQAAADVAVGYALATGSYSVAFTHGELNSNVYFNVVVGAAATDDIRAGNFNLSVNTTIGPDGNITPYSNLLGTTASTPINQYGVPTGIFNGQVTYAPNFAVNNNVASTQQNDLTYVDPLILDLNGDGIQLTSFADRTVLFDIDHDALGSKEQTGWVKMNTTTPATGATGANAIRMDGILVHDLNGNGKIDGINETLSQYYNGTIGSNGTDGQQKYSNGFTALKSLDSNADNQFTAADAAYSSLRVWVDSNADGISDAGELKTLTELGITAINLNATAQSGLINGGNEVLASGSFTQTINGLTQTRVAQAVDFIANPAGSTFTVDATGVRINTEVADGGQATTAYAYTGTDNANLNTATLNVNNLYGNTGNDTLTGDANANWLGGGAGGATNDSEWRMQA